MATDSSILAWKIPWTEEPGGVQSIRLQRIRHSQATEHTHTHPNLDVYIHYLDPSILSLQSAIQTHLYKKSTLA